MKIYLAGYPSYQSYLKWIQRIEGLNISIVKNPVIADLMVLAGGEDISPDFYGEEQLSSTYVSKNRDISEAADIAIALEKQIPMLGICRGAQLLCAVAGGKVVQDMRHPSKHTMYAAIPGSSNYTVLNTNSLHHQMAYPYNLSKDHYRVLAKAHIFTSDDIIKIGQSSIIKFEEIIKKGEPEIVWYKKIKALGIQGHPEMLVNDDPFVQYCKNLFTHYFIEKHD